MLFVKVVNDPLMGGGGGGGYLLHRSNSKAIKHIQRAITKAKLFRDNLFEYVVNLTNKTFTYTEFKLLNQNLNFVLTPGKYNKATFDKDKKSFFRNTLLKAHFGNDDDHSYKGIKPKINNGCLSIHITQ